MSRKTSLNIHGPLEQREATELSRVNLGNGKTGRRLADFAVKEILILHELENQMIQNRREFCFSLSTRTINDLKTCGYLPPYTWRGKKASNIF